jgi:hypothetical protein
MDLLIMTLAGVLIVSAALAEIIDTLVSHLSFAVWKLTTNLQTWLIRPSA